MNDSSFTVNEEGLRQALQALVDIDLHQATIDLPKALPIKGIGEHNVIVELAPLILGGARHLGSETAFAHMDPPTPWITWATTMWNAALNQNLLHPDVAPVAREIETQVVAWLKPFFGMSGGHMTPGSTVANLTALWAARELHDVKRVLASKAAHVSIPKAAHILGLEFVALDCDASGCLDLGQLPDDLSDAAVVLTAGTTSCGAIDSLSTDIDAAWVHVDAAWAGPLRLSPTYGSILAGIEKADSVSVSAHKWFFQPKESGLIFFKDVASAHRAISFGAGYLAIPNVGLLGSHGANAVPLLATLLCWGLEGFNDRISRAMGLADQLHQFLREQSEIVVFGPNVSGVILWRAKGVAEPRILVDRMPAGSASTTRLVGEGWVRHVAANPNADMAALRIAIQDALSAID